MVDDTIQYLKDLKKSLDALDGEFKTVINKDEIYKDIKKKITNDLKREIQGRSSYGIGV